MSKPMCGVWLIEADGMDSVLCQGVSIEEALLAWRRWLAEDEDWTEEDAADEWPWKVQFICDGPVRTHKVE